MDATVLKDAQSQSQTEPQTEPTVVNPTPKKDDTPPSAPNTGEFQVGKGGHGEMDLDVQQRINEEIEAETEKEVGRQIEEIVKGHFNIATMSNEELRKVRDLPYTKNNFIKVFKRLLELGYVRTDNISRFANNNLRWQRVDTMEDVMCRIFKPEFRKPGVNTTFFVKDVILSQIDEANKITVGEGDELSYPLRNLKTHKITETINLFAE